MNDDLSEEQRFGRLYAKLVGSGPKEATYYSAQRARLLMKLGHASVPPARRSFRPVLGWLGASVAVAGLMFWLSLGAGTELDARWNGTAVLENVELVALAEARQLEFSDGSQMLVAPQSVIELDRVGKREAGVTLKDGHLSARIEKNTGVNWTVAAGPYRVFVVGTEFTVDWSRNSESFKVAVTEGIVRVSGRDLPSEGVQLRAGEEIVRTKHSSEQLAASKPLEDREAAPEAKAADSDPLDQPGDKSSSGETPTVARVRPPKPDSLEPRPEESPPESDESQVEEPNPDWQSLATSGDYQGALTRAEALGFTSLVEQSSASELLLLANAARYARRAQHAKQAYTALRQRFPQSHGARLSAFYLARLAGDVEGQPRTEARWLRTYLAEAPMGELSASARARLMETLRRIGDTSGAKAVARDYLKYHSDGPHRDLAHSLLRNTGQP